jgi:membrane-associated phospholipid phosphatase
MIQTWDLDFLMWMRSCHHPLAIWSAWAVATVAWKGVIFWILAGLIWLAGNRLLACQLAVALFLSSAEVATLKGVILRARPDLYAAQQLSIPMPELLSTTHSFPSGHTLVAAAAAVVLFRYLRDWRGYLLGLFVLLVGLARVFQGMHWFTDVIGSLVLGAAAGYAAFWICDRPFMKRFTGSRKPEIVTIKKQQEAVANRSQVF